ncbi:Insulin-like growth factor binding protein, N-terminal [Pseudocohnilembus persalinus]|uniref:Insulin-like growth factor binding protein, N-terminal n=1 Tax=Pseudocohnilembus persalinus TaxID=266149 RepID=A0A0V0QAD1_PSEPJ|nr:Insulin-like growth factor binding protein, N-terminal [Pseudocohnilembus persalinus]|eukprot:KRW99031.1 Insulin-like growth factor binding protein, N-terminal [Pseudocohnilembus persalinus]
MKINQTCQKCPQKCSTCSDIDSCLTCKDPQMSPPYCKIDNNQGKYLSEEDEVSIFLACESRCLTCKNSSDNCLSCNGENRLGVQQNCICMNGYYDRGGSLKDCIIQPEIIGCILVDNKGNCVQCQQNFYLSVQNQCKCYKGYFLQDNQCVQCSDSQYFNNFSNRCENCVYYNQKCLNECPKGYSKIGDQCQQSSQLMTQILVILCFVIVLIFGSILLIRLFRIKKFKKTQLNKEHNKNSLQVKNLTNIKIDPGQSLFNNINIDNKNNNNQNLDFSFVNENKSLEN